VKYFDAAYAATICQKKVVKQSRLKLMSKNPVIDWNIIGK